MSGGRMSDMASFLEGFPPSLLLSGRSFHFRFITACQSNMGTEEVHCSGVSIRGHKEKEYREGCFQLDLIHEGLLPSIICWGWLSPHTLILEELPLFYSPPLFFTFFSSSFFSFSPYLECCFAWLVASIFIFLPSPFFYAKWSHFSFFLWWDTDHLRWQYISYSYLVKEKAIWVHTSFHGRAEWHMW